MAAAVPVTKSTYPLRTPLWQPAPAPPKVPAHSQLARDWFASSDLSLERCRREATSAPLKSELPVAARQSGQGLAAVLAKLPTDAVPGHSQCQVLPVL